jgi:hypothetical protein
VLVQYSAFVKFMELVFITDMLVILGFDGIASFVGDDILMIIVISYRLFGKQTK